jgi:hypothetical protein
MRAVLHSFVIQSRLTAAVYNVVFTRGYDFFAATYQDVAPYFIREPSSQVAVEGSSVMLYCGANGRDIQGHPPQITWLKDGVTVYVSHTTALPCILYASPQ